MDIYFLMLMQGLSSIMIMYGPSAFDSQIDDEVLDVSQFVL